MLQRPLIGSVRPVLRWFLQTRNVRPTVKIGKDKFQLTVDVRQFTLSEIRVKACPEYVVVEGKQERKLKNGLLIRQFVRKFKLPSGCDPMSMESKLNNDGILTITAPRNVCDRNYPCETTVPIKSTGPEKYDDSFIRPEGTLNPCEVYLKVNPEKPPKPPDEPSKAQAVEKKPTDDKPKPEGKK